MRIHFCDLCNESVPQSDLDEGRAFLRKGRVVCASCDRSMSHPAGPAGPFSKETEASLAAIPALAVAEGRADGGLQGHAPHATPAPPPAYGAHGYAPVAPARARSGSGAGLGLVALLLTGGLAFWARGRFDRLDGEFASRTLLLQDAQGDARARVDQELSAQAQRAAEQGDRLAGEVRELREWLNAQVSAGEVRARQVEDRLTEFGQHTESMAESFDSVNRHDQELVFLEQRFRALEKDVQTIGERLAGLERRPSAVVPEVAPLAAEEAAPAPPPWMGLVEELASPNTSERWQAVLALGDTRDPAVSEYLLPALRDEDIFIRMVTARVLGDLGSPLGIPALIEALDDGEAAVREAAYLALRSLTKRDFPFDPVTEDASERARRIKTWREWWEKEKPRYLEG